MRGYRVLLIVCMLLLVSAQRVHTEANSQLYLSADTGSDQNSGASPSEAKASFQGVLAAISAKQDTLIPPVQIHVAAGIYEATDDGRLTIDTSLDLEFTCDSTEADGCVIDLTMVGGLFATVVQRQPVSFTGLHFQSNGFPADLTPSMLVAANSSSLNLINCTLAAELSPESPAQRALSAAKDVALKLTGSSFRGFSAAGGSVLFASQSDSVTIDGCSFESSVSSLEGGALVLDTVQRASVKNSQFLQCTAAILGGAVSVQSSKKVEFENTIFQQNTVTQKNAGFGGAVFANRTTELLINNCTFTENTATGGGGALTGNQTECNLYESRFEANTAQNGGALMLVSLSRDKLTTASISNCVMKNNDASVSSPFLFAQYVAVNLIAPTYLGETSTIDPIILVSGGSLELAAAGFGTTTCSLMHVSLVASSLLIDADCTETLGALALSESATVEINSNSTLLDSLSLHSGRISCNDDVARVGSLMVSTGTITSDEGAPRVLDNCPLTVQGSLVITDANTPALPSLYLQRAASISLTEGMFTLTQASILALVESVGRRDSTTPAHVISMDNTLFSVVNGAVLGDGIVLVQNPTVRSQLSYTDLNNGFPLVLQDGTTPSTLAGDYMVYTSTAYIEAKELNGVLPVIVFSGVTPIVQNTTLQLTVDSNQIFGVDIVADGDGVGLDVSGLVGGGSSSSSSSSSHHGLSGGQVAGIIIGVLLCVSLSVALAGYFYYRKHGRPFSTRQETRPLFGESRRETIDFL